MKIKTFFNVAKTWTTSHTPEILLGLGVGTFVATVVTASRATLKAEDVIIEHKIKKEDVEYKHETVDKELYSDDDYNKDKITLYTQTTINVAKVYALPLGLGLTSLACFFGSYGILKKRYAVVTAAYNSLAASFAAYRQRVIADNKGDDTYYMTGAKPKEITVTNEDGTKTKVKAYSELPNGQIASPYAFKFGKYKESGEKNKYYQGSRQLDLAYIFGQQDYLNDLLYLRCDFDKDHRVKRRGSVMLNESRELLGEDPTPTGAIVGNLFSNGEPGCNGFIDFQVIEASEIDPETGEYISCYWINPNVDGMIYDLLNKLEEIPFDPRPADALED